MTSAVYQSNLVFAKHIFQDGITITRQGDVKNLFMVDVEEMRTISGLYVNVRGGVQVSIINIKSFTHNKNLKNKTCTLLSFEDRNDVRSLKLKEIILAVRRVFSVIV